MYCYNCDSELTKADICPKCGADVRKYKKIIYASNALYNDGLARANVRDLQGAEHSLVQSIRLNKCNIAARNLLGLVYYETGEVVSALSEWVISSNLLTENNAAAGYIKDVQSNQNRLNMLEQSIRKYNKALEYCRQGSYDLAVIQLKKVLQLNPKYLRARQLLALLYIESNDLTKAGKELDKCAKIDVNNTTTLRYQREIREQMLPENGNGAGTEDNDSLTDGGVVKYRDGNETIIQPVGARSPSVDEQGPSLPMMLLNIGIGLLIGAAIVGFFVMPSQIQKIRSSSAAELKTVAEQSDAKTATISEQEKQITDLTSENEELTAELDQYKEASDSLTASDDLMKAVNTYLANPNDLTALCEEFSGIDYEKASLNASQEYKDLYTTFLEIIRPKLASEYYRSGYEAYGAGNYDTAIEQLELALEYGDKDTDENYAAAEYFLADSYYLQYRDAPEAQKSKYSGNLAKAQQYFSAVKSGFADSSYATDADTRLQEISLLKNQSVNETTDDEESEGGTVTQETNDTDN